MANRVAAAAGRMFIGHTTLVAYLALLLASSSAVYAASIGSADVIDNSLQSVDLRDGAAVKGVDIVNGTVAGADVDEATLTGVGRKVIFSATPSTPKTNIGTVAGYTFKAACQFSGDALYAPLWVNGPAGDYQYFATSRESDAGDFAMESGGASFPASTDFYLLFVGTESLAYRRASSQFWIHSGATVLLLDVHVLADYRDSGACTIYGMVTKGV